MIHSAAGGPLMRRDLVSVTRQFLIWLVITYGVIVAIAYGRKEWQLEGSDLLFVAIIVLLSIAAVVGAFAGIWARVWLFYAPLSLVVLFGLLMADLALMEVLHKAELDRIGPAGTAFLLPLLVGLFAHGIAGAIVFLRFLVFGPRQPSPAHAPD
jgi:hypothetical protein